LLKRIQEKPAMRCFHGIISLLFFLVLSEWLVLSCEMIWFAFTLPSDLENFGLFYHLLLFFDNNYFRFLILLSSYWFFRLEADRENFVENEKRKMKTQSLVEATLLGVSIWLDD
jgi:hypothetical protein